jgi:cellulose synthase/poly-beta-1,6-N-acetylglucosamine synthase-like glycosyltransferase
LCHITLHYTVSVYENKNTKCLRSAEIHFTMFLQRVNFGGVSMDAFFAHAQELLSQGYIQVLIGMYVAAQVWWWVKKAIGLRAPHHTHVSEVKYSVIIVAYRPDPARLSRTLKSVVMYGSPAEIIVAIDDAPKAPKKLKTIAAKYATKVIEAAYRQGARELYAKSVESLKKRSDVIITVAPGAVWDESTSRITAAFTDERVGAASGHEVIVRPSGFAQKLGDWLNRAYLSTIVPFQSALGAVRPLSPHIMAVRRDIFTTSVVANRHETFLGRRVLTAHNESITARILAAGQRTVYQQDAVVTVPTPETLAGLRHGYVQRYRGNVRSLVRHTGVIRKINPLVTASAMLSLFSPVAYISIIAVCAFMVAYGVPYYVTNITSTALLITSGLVCIAYLALGYLRHFATIRTWQDALWLPLYMPIGGLIMLWAKTIALFTFAENTRDSKTGTEYGEGKVGRSRTAAAGMALILFIIALPVAYMALVKPQNVPLSAITGQQGRPYALAREYAERLRDTNTQNDPTDAEILTFVRANSAHYGQSVSENVVAEANICVRDALKTSSLHGALDNTQACYARALAIMQDTDPHSHVHDNHDESAHGHNEPVITATAKDGDTLTWLIRAEVKRGDTKKELSAAQAVYIETTYLSQTGQLNRYMNVGEKAQINLETLETLTKNAKELNASQIAAWSYYAQNIVW